MTSPREAAKVQTLGDAVKRARERQWLRPEDPEFANALRFASRATYGPTPDNEPLPAPPSFDTEKSGGAK